MSFKITYFNCNNTGMTTQAVADGLRDVNVQKSNEQSNNNHLACDGSLITLINPWNVFW